MKTINVSAPGKIYLLGEHAVVYGKPSILAAVDKRCFVEIIPRKDTLIEIISKNFDAVETLDEKTMLAKTKIARKQWTEFLKTNDVTFLKAITANPLDYASICIGETLLYYNQSVPSGFTITIDSEVTSGMGSSASLAVAIAGAVSLFLGQPFDRKVINEIAFSCEQKQHGFPSGGDNSVCTYGGFIWYRKETPDVKIIQPLALTLSATIAKNFFLINTGKPKESTGEMVSMVRALTQKRPAFAEKLFADQEKLVRDLSSALKTGNEKEIIQTIKDGEKKLEKLGVVSAYSKSLIRQIEKTGGAAKICGGGGRTKKTGIILVYPRDIKLVTSLIKSYNLSYFGIVLGTEGVKVHNI